MINKIKNFFGVKNSNAEDTSKMIKHTLNSVREKRAYGLDANGQYLFEKGLKKNEQKSIILRHLRKYGSITNLEAYDKYRILRCQARIYELEQRGFVIDRSWDNNGKSGLERKKWRVYTLIE